MSYGDALIQTLFEQRSKPRGDELLTHVSDLTTCLRAVAYRRRGLTPAPLTPQELAKFAIGHAYEHSVADTLRDAGHEIQEKIEVPAFGLDVGHPDIVIDREILLETKTTDAFTPKPAVSPNHAIQASAYAMALDLPCAVVLVKCAGGVNRGHSETTYDVDPEDYRDQIAMLAREVIALTGPEMPLPAARPKLRDVVPYDECGYCRWHQCPANPNHMPGFEDEE